MPYLSAYISEFIQYIASLSDITAWILPLLIAITFHEAAHGYVARLFGDPTAYLEGRVTFNPFRHIDYIGTLLLPAMLLVVKSPVLFGYAKPVPVAFSLLQPRRLGEFCVALAGPAINIILALAAGLLLQVEQFVTPEQAPWMFLNLYRFIIINCTLAVFNMIPLLPLDGGRVVASILPEFLWDYWMKLERAGLVILVVLLFFPVFTGVDILQKTVSGVSSVLIENVLTVTGNTVHYEGD